jgi:Zn-dependent protease with chaperone function
VNPFQGRGGGRSLANLFSTHPPTEARIARLEEIRRNLNLA